MDQRKNAFFYQHKPWDRGMTCVVWVRNNLQLHIAFQAMHDLKISFLGVTIIHKSETLGYIAILFRKELGLAKKKNQMATWCMACTMTAHKTGRSGGETRSQMAVWVGLGQARHEKIFRLHGGCPKAAGVYIKKPEASPMGAWVGGGHAGMGGSRTSGVRGGECGGVRGVRGCGRGRF